LEMPTGGFHAAAWDPAHDVEYTFYGLGCRALLHAVR
jgi:geranylgeranyl transferase type-2 subunit beta